MTALRPAGAPIGLFEERAAMLAHELRTPLAMIIGYVELLETRDDEETRVEAPMRIREAAERLDSLIETLLTASVPVDIGIDAIGDRLASATPSLHRVLVVDDDAGLRELLRMTLLPEEFEIVEAADGKEALELARAERPDLVLLDWQMPGVAGADVLAELKAIYPELPIVVLTVERRPHMRAVARSLQADVFVTKPFSPLELLATVDRLLG